MFSKTMSAGKKLMPVMLFVIIFAGLGGLCLHAGTCEDAFARCMVDVGWTSPLYCGVGWVFCKKYIA